MSAKLNLGSDSNTAIVQDSIDAVDPGEQRKDQGQEGDQKFVPPKDGSWVPRERLNEAVGKVHRELQSEREARIRLEEQIKQLAAAQQQHQQVQQKVYTPAELRKFVEDGQISQDQADAIYTQQQQKAVHDEIQKALAVHSETTMTVQKIDGQLKEYIDLVPDLMVNGSQNRQKVADHYQRLAKLFGQPKPDSLEDTRLQVAACEAAFGGLNALRQRKAMDITSENRETAQEIGFGGKNETASSEETKVTKKLNARQRAYYSSMIEKGFYKDWSDVADELKYAKR